MRPSSTPWLSLLLVSLAGAPLFFGAAPAHGLTCAEPGTVEALDVLLKRAERSIYVVKFDQALGLLDEAEAAIPCIGEIVPQEALTRLFLYRGVVTFNQKNEVAALSAFRQALAVEPNLRWNERFGQRPLQLFLEAKGAVISEAPGTLRLPTPADDIRIYLNGKEMDRAGGESSVAAGRHLLQVFQSDFLLEGAWLDVPSGGVVQPALPRAAGTWIVDTPAPVESSKVARSFPSWFRPAGTVALGVGGVALVGGAASGALYLQSKSALLEGDFYANRDDEDKEALLLRNQRTALITSIALPAGVVLSGAGAALYILGKPSPTVALGPGLLTPWVSGEVAGLQFGGGF